LAQIGSQKRLLVEQAKKLVEAICDLQVEAISRSGQPQAAYDPYMPDSVVEACDLAFGLSDHRDFETLSDVLYRERRLRIEVFEGSKLFREPGWDMLLDLMTATNKGKRLSVTSLCIGSCVPLTTALRWIGILEQEGLVTREIDNQDARRFHIALSADGYKKMKKYLCALHGARR
jgi:hypothetical protein